MQYGLDSRFHDCNYSWSTDGHGFRYCVPMDGHRPDLDLKFYKDICPDQNGVSLQTIMTILLKHFKVPIIVVFTKYDQFLRNVKMEVMDYPDKYLDRSVSEVAKEQFQEHYLHPLGDVGYVQLESELKVICQGHMLMYFGRNAH